VNSLIIQNVEDSIIEINNIPVIIDASVARLYGVTTRDINKSVKNNPEKFPHGYVFELTEQQKSDVVEIFHRFNNLKHSNVNPKAFTEQGLYMLATILKSKQATETTIELNLAVLKLKHTITKKAND
jgi:hypothetical protein